MSRRGMTDAPLIELGTGRTVDRTCNGGWKLEGAGLDQGIAQTKESTAHRSRVRLWWKRPLDVTLSGAILVVSAPLLAALTLLVRLESRGPALYRQERVGLDGQLFTMFKLRTMLCNNDENQHRQVAANWFAGVSTSNGYKAPDDPRVTRVGRVLRRLSIDEVPQLLNVVRGDMSLVGPRPAIPYELKHYTREYFERQTVPPGITGLWQVMGRDQLSAREMMELDLQYVRQASPWLDLKILAMTGPAVLADALRAH
jgi:lipopolysaccharide/colanic/teichoic acid biosynthesis glycosyltransferase